MEVTATPPVLVMVTGTIGMGQYGGGSAGKVPVDGEMCKLTVLATVVVVGATVVGGFVVRGVVGTVGDGT